MKDEAAREVLNLSCSLTRSMDEEDIGAVDDSQAFVVRPSEDVDRGEGPRNELLQMQRIRELDMEPLEEEEDDSEKNSVSDNDSRFLLTPVQLYRFLAVAGSLQNFDHFCQASRPYHVSYIT